MDFILRQQLTSDQLPPWAGIVFKYPVDSDALSEKLRAAYPDCKTLRERKHRAAIDFLNAELSRMQSENLTTDPIPVNVFNVATQEASPGAASLNAEMLSDGSEPLSVSGCTSPSILDPTRSPGVAEQTNRTARVPADPILSPTKSSPTSAQQFVWSAHDGRSFRPKIKRKMTVEERNSYKETRKRGACDKCRKQKGRCTHVYDDGQWRTEEDTNRRSAGNDVSSPKGSKSLKLEHASDIHHEAANGQEFQRQRTLAINSPSIYHIEGPLPNGRDDERTNEYVPSQNLINSFGIQTGKDQEPWSAYATRNPSVPDYVLDPAIAQSLSSPPAPPFVLQPELVFYDGTWIRVQGQNQIQSNEFNPPE